MSVCSCVSIHPSVRLSPSIRPSVRPSVHFRQSVCLSVTSAVCLLTGLDLWRSRAAYVVRIWRMHCYCTHSFVTSMMRCRGSVKNVRLLRWLILAPTCKLCRVCRRNIRSLSSSLLFSNCLCVLKKKQIRNINLILPYIILMLVFSIHYTKHLLPEPAFSIIIGRRGFNYTASSVWSEIHPEIAVALWLLLSGSLPLATIPYPP